jgi:hypothetical protein
MSNAGVPNCKVIPFTGARSLPLTRQALLLLRAYTNPVTGVGKGFLGGRLNYGGMQHMHYALPCSCTLQRCVPGVDICPLRWDPHHQAWFTFGAWTQCLPRKHASVTACFPYPSTLRCVHAFDILAGRS